MIRSDKGGGGTFLLMSNMEQGMEESSRPEQNTLAVKEVVIIV